MVLKIADGALQNKDVFLQILLKLIIANKLIHIFLKNLMKNMILIAIIIMYIMTKYSNKNKEHDLILANGIFKYSEIDSSNNLPGIKITT
jgi:hypothetical protein